MLGDGEVLKLGGAQSRKKSKKCSSSSSRRFSDEQIKSLESLFKMESKLEPRKKLEMARELGLHPRQVAIWFQNRRARWKSKQVEQDYTTLKADYDTLNHRFESLKNEKHALLQQLRNLCNQLKEPPHEAAGSNCKFDLESGSENGDMTNLELNGSGPVAALEQQDTTTAIYNSDEDDPCRKHSTDDDDINVGLQKLQELDDEMNMEDEAHETVSNFDDLASLFDQYACSSNWWDV